MKKILKKFLNFYYDWEHCMDLTGGFILILAFVMILPQMVEMQMGLIIAIVTLSVGIKITFSRLKKTFPNLVKETNQEYFFNEQIEELKRKIEKIERRSKNNGNKEKK